jgi:hypothetical protein
MPIQECPLCNQTKDLVSSHLMPAALYDYCRPPGGNPVAFNTRLVIESSRQMQYPLLCRGCEDILNKGGEGWILPLFARLDGTFPFHDLLTQIPPAVADGDAKVYATAQNPEIDAAKLTHFAMGIFWKAAVHSWRAGETEPLIDLGAYAEPIRKYLFSEGPFPAEMLLMIGVLPKPVKHIAFNAPYQGSSVQWRNFLFYVLGIEFTLLAGNALTKDQFTASFTGNLGQPILLFNFAPSVQDIAVDVMNKAHKAKNVGKYLTKP